jgi:hypothetical protein
MFHVFSSSTQAKFPLVGLIGLMLLLLSASAWDGAVVLLDPAGPKLPARGNPSTSVYRVFGNHSVNLDGVVITAHTFQARPKYIAIVYSVACSRCGTPPDLRFDLEDAQGNKYASRQDIEFGREQDIKVGLLITEPYIEGGKVLSLIVRDAGKGGVALSRLDILENTEIQPQSSFTEGGRLAPEEGVVVGAKTVYTSGAPGTRAVEMAVREGGLEREYYGLIESNGAARAVTEAEYRSSIPQPPSGFATPPATSGETPASP